jgi:hypothetical protein
MSPSAQVYLRNVKLISRDVLLPERSVMKNTQTMSFKRKIAGVISNVRDCNCSVGSKVEVLFWTDGLAFTETEPNKITPSPNALYTCQITEEEDKTISAVLEEARQLRAAVSAILVFNQQAGQTAPNLSYVSLEMETS